MFSWWTRSRLLTTRSREDSRGNVALIVAGALLTLTMVVGAGVDLTRAYYIQTVLQNAADAGSIAGANSTDPTAAKTAVENYLNTKKLSPQIIIPTPVPVVTQGENGNMNVQVPITAQVPTYFLHLAGYKNLQISVSATAERVPVGLEIALALDVTDSMSSSIAALRTAAQSLVDAVMNPVPDGVTVQVAVLPFTDLINIGPSYLGSPWLNVPTFSGPSGSCYCVRNTITQCTNDSGGTYTCAPCLEWSAGCGGLAFNGCTGTRPTYDQYFRAGWGRSTLQTFRPHRTIEYLPRNPNIPEGTDGYLGLGTISGTNTEMKCGDPILPLTDDYDVITAKISSLRVLPTPPPDPKLNLAQNTYIPTGLIWGWNALTARAPLAEATTADEALRQGIRKILVLMTDGTNVLPPRQSGVFDYVQDSDGQQLLNDLQDLKDKADADMDAVCTNIFNSQDPLIANSRDRIKIYTILYNVDDTSTETILKKCAEDTGGEIFSAKSTDDLKEAFKKIGQELKQVRLTK